ncbi:uncharacterized protein LOC133477277 isoform X3 [Phyllopteryx taeniolatus]|uniref:uncharacterized protein LOC133477277 isoform X3 n=1 Tax=Phyllopteryx taeniolatus TaxID=161469 RepID=UPI002AD2C123|nr:uncharacterized protein LOC133477277 isoform X3 [Phyllopteryx taeniolatus]
MMFPEQILSCRRAGGKLAVGFNTFKIRRLHLLLVSFSHLYFAFVFFFFSCYKRRRIQHMFCATEEDEEYVPHSVAAPSPTVTVPRAPDACSGDSIVCVSKDLPAALFRHVFIMLIQPDTEAGRRERGTIAPQIEESRCHNTKGQRRCHPTSRLRCRSPLAHCDGGRTGDLKISGQGATCCQNH